MTQGTKSSEFVVLVAGVAAAVLPVVLDKVPPDGVWAVVLGALLAAATYIAGRSHVKATTIKANALMATADVTKAAGEKKA